MKIEQRVMEAINAGSGGDFAKGMTLICPAIEATARKSLKATSINGKKFKDFLRGYNQILEPFIGAGLNLDETKFPNVSIETDNCKIIESPDFADIIYHAFRCSLAHGHEVSEKFFFTKSLSQGISQWVINSSEGRIHMPDKVLWALTACVVFCEANRDIATESSAFLTWGGAPSAREPAYHFDIDVFWGAEDTVRRFFLKKKLIRVAMRHD